MTTPKIIGSQKFRKLIALPSLLRSVPDSLRVDEPGTMIGRATTLVARPACRNVLDEDAIVPAYRSCTCPIPKMLFACFTLSTT